MKAGEKDHREAMSETTSICPNRKGSGVINANSSSLHANKVWIQSIIKKR